MFDFSVVTHWVDQLLRSFLPEGWAILTEFILIGLCLLVGYAVIALVLIYVERKVCAFFQCRLGPNRVGYCHHCFGHCIQLPAFCQMIGNHRFQCRCFLCYGGFFDGNCRHFVGGVVE